MNPSFFARTEELYRSIDDYLPSSGGNPCNQCRLCCTGLAFQGVSELEFDYIEEYLIRKGKDPEQVKPFRKFIGAKKRGSPGPADESCPFHSGTGCSIYEARTLSCRTFGYFIRAENLSMIPESCAFRKKVILYTVESFGELIPFAVPFYSLVGSYDRFLQV